jgi:YtxH-like protein
MIPYSTIRKIYLLLAQFVEFIAQAAPVSSPFPRFKNPGKDFPLHMETRIMNNTSKILLGFIAGAAIGGALGILLAPDKGSETRRKIVEKGSELGESISESVTGLGEKVKESVAGFGDKVKDKFKNSMS